MPNHFHFLVRTGEMPLSKIMQKLETRYAVNYNLRHHRSGHFFQNRYKAILVEEDEYLLELVRYIHLNPIRTGGLESLESLEKYRWCGYGALMGKEKAEWQGTGEVLRRFGTKKKVARRKMKEFMEAGLRMGGQENLRGGGLVRSAGGVVSLIEMARAGEKVRGDERILGSGEFVAKVLRDLEKRDRRKGWIRGRMSPSDVIEKAGKVFGLDLKDVVRNSKRPEVVKARSLACKWLVEDMGITGIKVSRMLGISNPTVSRCVLRGKELEQGLSVKLGIKDE